MSLRYLFDNGSNVNARFNTKYVKNQTLFNMIKQNKNVNPIDSLQLLMDYKFDFEKLINVYDNVKQENGLMKLCSYSPNYEIVKMLFDHCKTLKKCKIDISHCDINKQNVLFYASQSDINTFKHLLTNINRCFPNHDEMDNKNIETALNQKDIYGGTVAHHAAYNPSPHIVNTFKLLQEYNFNFNIYNNYGRLPIHIACMRNCVSLLSWMIDENILNNDINCQTKYAKNKNDNGFTPLYFSVEYNSVDCVNVLCKQTNRIDIHRDDIFGVLDDDNAKILKLLLRGLFGKYKISNWNDIVKSIVSINEIKSMISYCINQSIINESEIHRSKCYQFLNDLLVKGYSCCNFKYIVLKLDYDLKTVINDNNSTSVNDDEKSLNEYQIEKDLGKGTFGLVQLAKHKQTQNKVAIKHINLKTSKNQTPIQFITSEIESLKKLSTHKNIINLLNYKILSTKVLLYFEYCFFGDLYSLLNQCDFFSMRISFRYFTQLLSAIQACHKMNIVHRDLKLQNILISDTFQLKVADFGLASIVDFTNEDQIYNVGTPMYKSPELLERNSSYDIEDLIVLKSCDVFSLSIIYWQMMNGIEYLPFRLYKRPININNTKYQFIKYGQYNQFWSTHKNSNIMAMKNPVNIVNLLEQMFEYNPYQRITIDEILRHKWIIEHENDVLFL